MKNFTYYVDQVLLGILGVHVEKSVIHVCV